MNRSHPAPNQMLEQLRNHVRWFLSSIYLVYFVFWVSLQPFHLPDLLSNARTWMALVALLGGGLGTFPRVTRPMSRPALIGLTFLMAATVTALAQQTLSSGERLGEMLVWFLVVLLLGFILLGSMLGLTLAGVMLLALVAMTMINSPLHSLDLHVLLTGVFGAVSVMTLGFLTMNFIEQHLTLHEQTADQLAAARKDALTGVLGRAALEEEMRRTTQHARKTGTPLSLIVTDIDHFKRVNDRFGHGAGDDVLRAFSKRLRRNVGGSGGMVGRWGGEEFVILLPGVARPDALAMAERLRLDVIQAAVAGHRITASFGVSSFRPAGEDDMDALFGRADERLYEAKNAGRNTVRG